MSNGFLSQEEIDALLNGGEDKSNPPSETSSQDVPQLSDIEKDLLGEIGNISMGSASTALSTIINQQVNITTPVVAVTTLEKLKNEFETPNVALEVKYTEGIIGENLLVMKLTDAAVISSLMMGGDGKIDSDIKELGEIEISAVSEAMNQMIGSAATSMATMLMREVNISPPISKIWNDLTKPLTEGISEEEPVVEVCFSLKIGDLVDSSMMQILPISTAKKVVAIMMGQEEKEETTPESEPAVSVPENNSTVGEADEPQQPQQPVHTTQPQPQMQQSVPVYEKPIETVVNKQPVEVSHASFEPLGTQQATEGVSRNIDLILDVPLEISVVLGRTKKNIKDILNLGTGSLIELDKLAEEPVEILVNGKKVAYGEVVVVDENFGVRITGIVSNEEKIKSLAR